tara:strand:+ start:151 stop:624 length:474 start_codon:yes stop_codon:yes gene_type:complete
MENEDNKIGWQKYESLIEEQLSSTFLSDLFNKIILQDEEDEEVEEAYESAYDQEESGAMSNPAKVALNSKIMEDIGMITNFDCWIGHTNFDITPDIKKNLDSVKGIEVLKIFSRYRFFIGIGKMFNFKSVRNGIEELLLKKERKNGYRPKNRRSNEQ